MRVGLILALVFWTVIFVIVFLATHAHASPLCRGQSGIASWYGTESGHKTATGAYFNGRSMTAATLIFPLGSRLKVTDMATGRSIVVQDNDHGPYIRGRIIDLSKAAAHALGMNGLARVCVERIG